MNKSFAIALLTAGLASCATVPVPLQGQFAATTPRDTGASGTVRWGGEIIKVEPKTDMTCFEILSRNLDASARPMSRDPSSGRFIACRAGFYDPEEFERGRDLTVVGRVTGTDRGKVGEFDYAYPHVAADTIYLWPKRVPYVRQPYYDPFYGPWGYGPYWGAGWGGYPYWGWGGPTVIIRDHPRPPPRPAR